jgi:hypothetical protein
VCKKGISAYVIRNIGRKVISRRDLSHRPIATTRLCHSGLGSFLTLSITDGAVTHSIFSKNR